VTVIKHILHCPTLGYPKDKGRRDILKKNLEWMGCAMLLYFPWRYANKKMIKEIVARRSMSFLTSIRAKSNA
jgi:hypothetical protein